MHRQSSRLPTRSARRGLAPLELVLVLPLLLFMMALMMNFGSASAWKARSLGAARQGVWRDRAGRNGSSDPRPSNWPDTAQLGSAGANELSTVRAIWDVSPLNSPFARGTNVSGQSPQTGKSGHIQLRDLDYLEIPAGVKVGTSDITRSPTLLPKTRGYAYHVKHPLVDNQWQYFTMGYENGKPDVVGGGNYARRSYYWYMFDESPEWSSESSALKQADASMLGNPQAGGLIPLDRDQEFLPAYPWGFQNFQDFYPMFQPGRYGTLGRPHQIVSRPCTLDPESVRNNVNQLVNAIQGRNGGGRDGVPGDMAQTWIRLYDQQINYLRGQLAGTPEAAQADAAINGQIAAIEAEKQKYVQFQGTLN